MDMEELGTIYVERSKKPEQHQRRLNFEMEENEFSLKEPDDFGKNIAKYDASEADMEYENEQAENAVENDLKSDVVDFEDDDIPESNGEQVSGEVEGKGIFYKTKDVAKELGITEQDVRNYDKIFSEYLNVQRTSSGHRRYTREYIDKLAAILELKRINNYTFEQTKEALSTDEGQIMSARDEMDRLHKLLELMTSRIEISGKEVKQAVREEIQRTFEENAARLLTDQSEKNEQIEALKRQNEELKEALVANQTASAQSITELKEQLNESKKQNEKIVEMLSSVLADQQSKESRINELAEQNEKVLAEVTKKKKGWFFNR